MADATEIAMQSIEDLSAEELKKLTPEDLFRIFDTDGSGSMDLEEFKIMLGKLNVKMAAPKALKYFRMCDQDGSGEISLEEFKVALFATDPVNGNEIGFSPTALLTPLDTFMMFDENNSGGIDEDEFAFIMEYMRVPLSDEKQEQLLRQYDLEGTGQIDYDAFKQIWLRVCDVNKELEDRGVEIPKFSTRGLRMRLLEKMLGEEEEAERHAMAEAARYRAWMAILEQKNVHIKKARRRAQIELAKALDCAGQVYTFGRGSLRQFDGAAEDTGGMGEKLIRKMWRRRVTAGKDDLEGSASNNAVSVKDAIDVESLAEEMASSHFRNLTLTDNTAMLWGRRVTKVAIAETVMLAISDMGDMWTWGGADHWWYELEPGSAWQAEWRGDTTPRSQLLLGTVNGTQEDESEGEEEEETDEQKTNEKLKTALMYYDAWSSPPPGMSCKRHYEEQCLPKVDYAKMKTSLEVRGKTAGDATKATLAKMLHRDITLERRVLGEKAHRRISELEEEIHDLERRRKRALAKRLRVTINKMWLPLREIQAEEDAEERAQAQTKLVEAVAKREKNYEKWRKRVVRARRAMDPELTDRGNSIVMEPGGITERGRKQVKTTKGYAAVRDVAAGAQHLACVHASGQLYTWGIGASGRLGLDVTQNGDPRADSARPTLVQALESVPVVALAAGHSHTACITASRDLYLWGSAGSGKLGVGKHAREAECYASLPMRVRLPGRMHERVLVRHVSCGAAHTATVTTTGSLYVWGCGDGGRLGLGGDGHGFRTVWEPERVESLDGVCIAEVAAGNACTLCTTVYEEKFGSGGKSTPTPKRRSSTSSEMSSSSITSKIKTTEGGALYVAGAAAVLGREYSSFERLTSVADRSMVKIAAGFAHQGCVSSMGELFLWGVNNDGCCGKEAETHLFLEEPTLVPCLYERPTNLALHKPARLSSVYGGLDAEIAFDGDQSGDNASVCAQTQQDPQPWIQVDLGAEVAVQTVRVWNRIDEPTDKTMPRDTYTSRLFPSWLMIAQEPYSEEVGGESLKRALNGSVARMQLTKNQRLTTWFCPENTFGRHVRLQLEGFEFLHVAQIEVCGIASGASTSVGRCFSVDCGKHVTAAVVKASTDPEDVSRAYKRAVYADAHNADILRERETYALEYDKHGRGEKLLLNGGSCLICTNGRQCEVCTMKHIFKDDLEQLTLGVAGRALTLDETAELLLGAAKPPLEFVAKEKQDNSIAAKIKRRLASKPGEKKKKKNKKKSIKGIPDDDDDDEEKPTTRKNRATLFSRTKKVNPNKVAVDDSAKSPNDNDYDEDDDDIDDDQFEDETKEAG